MVPLRPWTSLSAPLARTTSRRRPGLRRWLGAGVVGYVKLRPPLRIPSNAHVLQIQGLAVDPAHRQMGIGRRLVLAAVDQARRRGARKVSLRVLATNRTARALYESCGFTVEGILRAESTASRGTSTTCSWPGCCDQCRAAHDQGPSSAAKSPSSSRRRTVVRKRAASAPSTIRWS